MANPPSLERLCFLHLLQHMEKFPVKSLSLLPVGIRHRLVLSAPVADVYQLEQTSFVKGINMDEVWRTLYEQRLPLISSLPDLCRVFGDDVPPRELMTSAIAFQILHNPLADHPSPTSHYKIPRVRHKQGQPHKAKVTPMQCNVLFSIVLHDDDPISSVGESMKPPGSYPGLDSLPGKILEHQGQEACRVMVPPRYASYDTAMSDDNTKKVEEFMATTCQTLPSVAIIKCNKVKGNIFGELLKKLEHVTMICDSAPNFSLALTQLLHHSSALQHITLGRCSDESIHALTSDVSKVLLNTPGYKVQRMSISISHVGKNRDYGFCGNAWDGAFQRLERKSQEASSNLGLMIPHIPSLHTLKLRNWWTRHSEHAHQDHVNLLDTLCSFLKQPHFQCLALIDTCLPLVYIQRLVRAFLLSPCSQPQTLRLEKLSLTSRLRIIRRLSGYYPSDKEVKLPLTEWDTTDSQGSRPIGAREFKTLGIAFDTAGGEGHNRKDDLITLEATRSWLSDLSQLNFELKSLVVQGDPCIQFKY